MSLFALFDFTSVISPALLPEVSAASARLRQGSASSRRKRRSAYAALPLRSFRYSSHMTSKD